MLSLFLLQTQGRVQNLASSTPGRIPRGLFLQGSANNRRVKKQKSWSPSQRVRKRATISLWKTTCPVCMISISQQNEAHNRDTLEMPLGEDTRRETNSTRQARAPTTCVHGRRSPRHAGCCHIPEQKEHQLRDSNMLGDTARNSAGSARAAERSALTWDTLSSWPGNLDPGG